MPLGTAAGYPQYKDQGAIMTAYSSLVNVKYYAECMLPMITNSKYEGEIKDKGDKVVIYQRPNIVTKPYKKGQVLDTQVPSSEPIELDVDQARYYNFVIDDIDADMAHIVLNDEFTEDGTENMKIDTETDFLGSVYADAHASNKGLTAGAKSGAYSLGTQASPLSVDTTNVVQIITRVKSVLGEQNAAGSNKKLWIVIPEWMSYLLVNSELKVASLTGDGKSTLRSGMIGRIANLEIYVSNLLTVTNGVTQIVGGNTDAITFAAAMTKSETLRAPNTFGQLYRGLHVYGWKTVKPEGLVQICARIAT